MKIHKTLLLFVTLAMSCHNNTISNQVPRFEKTDSAIENAKNKFKGLKYANPRDLSCRMPLTAGVEDTAVYNGKIYGFCSKECKEEFLKNPKASLPKEQ